MTETHERGAAWKRPACDTYRLADALEILVDVPGARRQDLRLTLEGSELRLETQPPEGSMSTRIPRYRRRIRVSSQVDRNAIRAQLQDGVLRVTLPLLGGGGRQTIAIEE